ncbi:hypothetical protein A3207_04215 [Candidatus Methanomassiliicoccus intestinalis]|uniref:fructose-bisphosphatase n=2 Tax=Candidatus Methanomassiliicoccus intestinalis TaxID=1406512 RepID=A0A8J8PF70_9ARCH|nr:MAG: hypothetical protein A3207_04215 [Candidatus Methanomassiliicoccus intestinalis]
MDALRLLMLKALDEIAHRVWRAVNNLPEEFDRGKTLYMGADGSPTSAIDKTAEDAILNAVDDLDLKVNILSEEAGYIDRGYSETLVVDPVDGTHNATLGLPFYTVSLAVGKNSLQGITQAVVKNLVTGDVYTAEKGEGSRLNNKPIHVKEFNTTFPSLLCYVGHHVPQDTFDKVVKCAPIRSLGCASVEMCMVANGYFDAHYYNTNQYSKNIRIVDIAASALILREAGGEIVDLNDKILDMPFDLDMRSGFIAYNDEKVKEILL